MSDLTDPSRRTFTLTALGALGGAALLAACSTADDTGDILDDTGDGADTDTADADVEWATGGTASMSGDYADPFAAETGTCSSMVCAMTLGPCCAESVERKDISEGASGLPVRLALRVLDTDCNPVAGIYVDVWHASVAGLYSGADASEMCTEGDADMTSHRYFRGYQKTDAAGRVDFDTCFPGWYSGRAVHIHFQVRTGTGEGEGESVTSQLFFEPERIEEIYGEHPEYVGRGQPDTPNDSDKVLGDNDPALYTLSSTRQADGALLAFKTIVIRASSAERLCEAPESDDGGGPP